MVKTPSVYTFVHFYLNDLVLYTSFFIDGSVPLIRFFYSTTISSCFYCLHRNWLTEWYFNALFFYLKNFLMYFMNTIFDTNLKQGMRTMSNDKQADLNGLKTILTMVGHLMYEGRTMLGQKCIHTTLRQTYTHNKRGNFTHMMGYSHSSHVQSCNDLYGIVNEDVLVDHHRVALAKHYCFKRFSRYTHRVEENLHSLSRVKRNIFCIIFLVFLTFFWTLVGISLNLHEKSLFGLEAGANLSQTEGVL